MDNGNNESSIMARRRVDRWFLGQPGDARPQAIGLIGDIIVGVVGALIGGWLATTLLKMPIQ